MCIYFCLLYILAHNNNCLFWLESFLSFLSLISSDLREYDLFAIKEVGWIGRLGVLVGSNHNILDQVTKLVNFLAMEELVI